MSRFYVYFVIFFMISPPHQTAESQRELLMDSFTPDRSAAHEAWRRIGELDGDTAAMASHLIDVVSADPTWWLSRSSHVLPHTPANWTTYGPETFGGDAPWLVYASKGGGAYVARWTERAERYTSDTLFRPATKPSLRRVSLGGATPRRRGWRPSECASGVQG